MAKKLVLAHGFLGFGAINILGWELAAYFRGVATAIDPSKLTVIQHAVPPAGSVKARADDLAGYLLRADVSSPEDELYFIAHSMGGLDVRQALQAYPELASRTRALVTIATPHRGSGVADRVLALTLANQPINPMLKAFLPSMDNGLTDLSTQACQDFNAHCPDVDGIHYYCIAGHANKAPAQLTGPLRLIAQLGAIDAEPCDGLVTMASAIRPGWERLPDWELDHVAQVGWYTDISIDRLQAIFDDSRERAHIDRYMALVALITGESETEFRTG